MEATRHEPGTDADQTRERILRAAVREFSEHGLAGARTDAIAEGGGQQGAALLLLQEQSELVRRRARRRVGSTVMASAMPPRTREPVPARACCASALNHFDRIAQPARISKPHAAGDGPLSARRERNRLPCADRSSGPFMQTHWRQVIARRQSNRRALLRSTRCRSFTRLGANVFYFLSAPMMRLAAPFEPLRRRAAQARRKAAIDF